MLLVEAIDTLRGVLHALGGKKMQIQLPDELFHQAAEARASEGKAA